MQYGVRNNLKATVTKVKKGEIMSQMECKIDDAAILTSVLTTDSVDELKLKEGDKIVILIKAIHVIPAKE